MPRETLQFLTLAETDAELQRLAVLEEETTRDEQYLARRSVRDLPDSIERLKRAAGWYSPPTQATMKAHEHDGLTVAGRAGDPLAALGHALDALPFSVGADLPLSAGHLPGPAVRNGDAPAMDAGGFHRGGNNAEGHTVPRAPGAEGGLSTCPDLDLAGGYGVESERTRQDLGIAEGRLQGTFRPVLVRRSSTTIT